MIEYSILKYTNSYYNQWNDFVAKSKNGTFLFHRDFMEYHSDRFEDYSLMVFNGEDMIAVLPAHKISNELYSHFGLTYGGLVYDDKIRLPAVIEAFKALLEYLHKNDIVRLSVKLIPSIYHKFPADEFNYALFVAGATLTRKDSLSVIDNSNRLPMAKIRKRNIKTGANNGLIIKEETKFTLFWNKILIPNLQSKHNVKPVHSAEEITMLHQRFPANIRQFNVYHDNSIIAGVTMFVTDTAAHSQYISGNADKAELGALSFLYNYLINEVFANKRFFDFGISNEDQGLKLNEGLALWKESFGARTIIQDFYEVESANFTRLDNVLI